MEVPTLIINTAFSAKPLADAVLYCYSVGIIFSLTSDGEMHARLSIHCTIVCLSQIEQIILTDLPRGISFTKRGGTFI